MIKEVLIMLVLMSSVGIATASANFDVRIVSTLPVEKDDSVWKAALGYTVFDIFCIAVLLGQKRI